MRFCMPLVSRAYYSRTQRFRATGTTVITAGSLVRMREPELEAVCAAEIEAFDYQWMDE